MTTTNPTTVEVEAIDIEPGDELADHRVVESVSPGAPGWLRIHLDDRSVMAVSVYRTIEVIG